MECCNSVSGRGSKIVVDFITSVEVRMNYKNVESPAHMYFGKINETGK